MAAIFNAISDGDFVIRTTPTSSPRASRILPSLQIEDRTATPTPPIAEDAVPGDVDTDDEGGGTGPPQTVGEGGLSTTPSQPPTIEEEKGRRRGSSRPPPILKKPRTESTSQQSKTARILTPTWKTPRRESDDRGLSSRTPSSVSFGPHSDDGRVTRAGPSGGVGQSTGEGPSSSTTQSTPSGLLELPSDPSRGSAVSTGKSGKKKPGFLATTASTKRRPAIGRRKSSQSSSSNTSKAPSPRIGSQNTPHASPPPPVPSLHLQRRESANPNPTAAESSGPSGPLTQGPATRSSRPTSRSASPVSSGPFHRPTRDHLPDPPEISPKPEATEGSQQDWLVDRDFRTKFADRFRTDYQPLAPFTPRLNASTKVSTSFQPQGSFGMMAQASSTDKGKGRAQLVEMTAQTTARHPSPHNDSAIEDDEDEDLALPLSRTKSQLTLLLRKDQQVKSSKGKQKAQKQKN